MDAGMTLLWFLAVIALIPVALWLLKRSALVGGAGAAGVMRTVAVLPLSPAQRLVTVEVGSGEDRRWLVLGVTAQQITALHSMPAQSEVAPPAGTAVPQSFAQVLEKLRGATRNAPGNQ